MPRARARLLAAGFGLAWALQCAAGGGPTLADTGPAGATPADAPDRSAGPAAADEDEDDGRTWQAKFQTTYTFEKKLPFHAAYTGPNSLVTDPERSYTATATAYLGWRPWRSAEVFVVPEVTQGLPFSNLTGLGGFTNGELTRASGTNPRLYRQKLYLRQTWSLGGGREKEEAELEQFGKFVDRDRFVLTAGNFAALDVFDDNLYAKDPRTQFMNWGNMAYAAYDYPADARGFAWGLAGEWYEGDWAFRFGRMTVPRDPNQLSLDHRLASHYGDQIELEHGHTVAGQPGRIRVLAYRDRARMASFQDALVYLETHPGSDPQAIFAVRTGDKVKYGFGVNAEQAIGPDLGAYLRAMHSDGHTETLAFTEVDQSLAAGLVLKAAAWGRPLDNLGLSFMQNTISRDRRNYLEAGGISFFIGDGALRYAPERIVELYYSATIVRDVSATVGWQHIQNPAYNADRGPVEVLAFRLHAEF